MTTELSDETSVARLAAQIAAENPCCTNAEIMEKIAEAVKAQSTPEETNG